MFSNVLQAAFPVRQLPNPILPPAIPGAFAGVIAGRGWRGLKPLLPGQGDGRGCVRPADVRRALRLHAIAGSSVASGSTSCSMMRAFSSRANRKS